jgi:hypothetical protein
VRRFKSLRVLLIALLLILLDALFWFIFSFLLAAGLHPSIPEGDLVRWGMAGLSTLTAGALLLSVFMLRKRSRVAYLLTLSLLGMISVLTVTDEFGFADLLVLLLHVIPMLFLWFERRQFFPSSQGDLQEA